MANKNKLMEKAQKYLQKGKLKDTIATLNEVINADPSDFRVLLKKGELESRIGDNEAAKNSYTLVAEQYSQDGFYLKAIAIYKKILKLDAEEFHIYSKLAFLYRKLGLDTEAKKNLRVVAEYYKTRGMKTQYNEIAMQLSELGENVSESQIAFAEKYVEGGESDKAIEQFRAMSQKYQDGGNVKQLDSIVRKMEEMGMKDLECFHIQARGYLNFKEPKKSLQVIQKAYSMDLQNTITLELLARCFTELKQPQKANSVFNELIKIYDRNGDMKNLARVKFDMKRALDPNSSVDAMPNFEDEAVSYDTIQREESEEFIIEEVQVHKPEPKKVASAISSVVVPSELSQEYLAGDQYHSSFSELEEGLEISSDQSSNASGNTFDRTGRQMPNEDSFMNVYVDAFDGTNDDTVLGKPTDAKPKPAKVESLVVPKVVKAEPKQEEPFSFDESSFEIDVEASSSMPKLDLEPDLLSANEVESTADLLNMNFDENAPEEKTILESAPSKQQLIGFDDFYSDNSKEKSEISVLEEEFVSVSQFLDEQKPVVNPEKIEIHDKVEPTVLTPANSILHDDLAGKSLNADIESAEDFSTLDLNEISLKIPGMDDSEASISLDEPVTSMEVDSLLDDAEPASTSLSTFADSIQLDEKTIMDIKHEFKETAKHERAVDNDFFDLAGELREEISEFEKSFGTMDDGAEEEFLSPEEVILEFKKGIARTIDKNDHQTHYNLGVAYKEMGLIDEAISAFELASNDPATRVDATSMIGICLADKSDYEAAVKLYLQILPTINYQDPKYLGIMYQLGEAYMALGRHVEAFKAFSKVKDLDAGFRDAKTRAKELGFNLGMTESNASQQSGKMIVDMKERKKNKR